MSKRIAAAMSLIVYAFCLVVGGLETGNPFSTTGVRAVIAMFATLVLGMVVGAMGEKMLEENLKSHEEKLKNSPRNSEATDR
jgi:hypothetical protein